MASKLLNATSEYQDSRGQWFTAHDPLITKPGAAGTDKVCFICVPFAHFLLAFMTASADIDATGTHTSQLFRVADGDATAGAAIQSSARTKNDSSGLVKIHAKQESAVRLTAAGKLPTTGAAMYWLQLEGTDANDLNHRPQLSLLVEPVIRSTL